MTTPTRPWSGIAVPFDYASVDTDAMAPVSGEETAAREGWGAALFGRWREDPAFIRNRPEYASARVLVAGPQFGIGSSRETAVRALAGAGFTTVVAPSFGEIFRANCVRNRVLTATVTRSDVDALQDWLRARPGAELVVDLEARTVTTGDGSICVGFDVDGFARRSLLDGIDEFTLLTAHARQIDEVLGAIGSWTPLTTRTTEGRP